MRACVAGRIDTRYSFLVTCKSYAVVVYDVYVMLDLVYLWAKGFHNNGIVTGMNRLNSDHDIRLRSVAEKVMMRALSTSETSVSFYHITRRNIPQGEHLHTHRR
jgi:hypothetical protein